MRGKIKVKCEMRAPRGACIEGKVRKTEIFQCTCSTGETDIAERGQHTHTINIKYRDRDDTLYSLHYHRLHSCMIIFLFGFIFFVFTLICQYKMFVLIYITCLWTQVFSELRICLSLSTSRLTVCKRQERSKQ